MVEDALAQNYGAKKCLDMFFQSSVRKDGKIPTRAQINTKMQNLRKKSANRTSGSKRSSFGELTAPNAKQAKLEEDAESVFSDPLFEGAMKSFRAPGGPRLARWWVRCSSTISGIVPDSAW